MLTGNHCQPGLAVHADRHRLSVADFAELFSKNAKEIYNYQGKVVFEVSPDEEYMTDNPNRRCPNIEKARIYMNGSNLLTFSKFKLWDPEMAGYGLGYPPQRVFNLGIHVNF